jgi:hypothetical protein
MGMIRHVALPVAIDLAILGALWSFITSNAGRRIDVLWIFPRWFPDIGLAFILITLFGLGWAVTTLLTASAMLRPGSASAEELTTDAV